MSETTLCFCTTPRKRARYGLTRAPPSLNKCLRELEDAWEQAQLAGGLGGAGLGLIRLTFRWKPSP